MLGKGVKARLGDARLMVGSPRFLAAEAVDIAAHNATINELESQGLTVIAVARNGALVGLLALGDALRPDATETVTRLHALGIHTSLITGDNEQAVGRIVHYDVVRDEARTERRFNDRVPASPYLDLVAIMEDRTHIVSHCRDLRK